MSEGGPRRFRILDAFGQKISNNTWNLTDQGSGKIARNWRRIDTVGGLIRILSSKMIM